MSKVISFDDAMVLTRTRGAELLLDDTEARAMYDALVELHDGATVVEIGCHWGRSSSLIAQVAKDKHFAMVFIDPFTGYADHAAEWMRMMVQVGTPFNLFCNRSQSAPHPLIKWIDLVYIDGQHEDENAVYQDCENFMSSVRLNGFALVHDYMRDSLPDVTAGVNRYLSKHPREWDQLGLFGHLGVWRRVG